jgi:hypothetical protein
MYYKVMLYNMKNEFLLLCNTIIGMIRKIVLDFNLIKVNIFKSILIL